MSTTNTTHHHLLPPHPTLTTITLPAILLILITLLAYTTSAHAETYTGPIKEILTTNAGSEANKTTKTDHCTITTNECQAAKESTQANGLAYTSGIAVNNDEHSPQYGNIYVIDKNHRVQELNPNGEYVSMFGWEVNETKDNTPGSTQTERNTCTNTSHDTCKQGTPGTNPEQLGRLEDIAIDPTNGDIYTTEVVEEAVDTSGKTTYRTTGAFRVQKFTAEGRFLLEIGNEVNQTTKSNLCTQEETEKGTVCGPPVPVGESTQPGVFTNAQPIAVSAHEDTLYVGDEHRVQEFENDGKYKTEIPLTPISSANKSNVIALTADEQGDVYLTYEVKPFYPDTIREFAPTGTETKNEHYPLTLTPRNPNADKFRIYALAIDSSGRLAVSEAEAVSETEPPFNTQVDLFGSLLDGITGHLLTEFSFSAPDFVGASQSPEGFFPFGLAFNASDEHDNLYASIGHEVLIYDPVSVAELASGIATCATGPERETLATFNCTLNGSVNPEKITGTDVFFEWGKTQSFEEKTPAQSIIENAPGETVFVSAAIQGLRPNDTLYYRLAGNDQNVLPPETLTTETSKSTTPTVPPKILGQLSTPFIHSSSAVMIGELNPENTTTTYQFQYAPEEQCASLETCTTISTSPPLRSSTYGKIGVTQEITGLQPGTTYRYRLQATNEKNEPATRQTNQEATFTTQPTPTVTATTGTTTAITTTSAIISDTINPDGQPATYTFELGIYNGPNTNYGTVFSGPTNTTTTPTPETLQLTGLQPGTTYAYRITITSTGNSQATSQTTLFTTNGQPTTLTPETPLPQLTIPNITPPKTKPTPPPKKKKPTPKPKNKKKKKKKKQPKTTHTKPAKK